MTVVQEPDVLAGARVGFILHQQPQRRAAVGRIRRGVDYA